MGIAFAGLPSAYCYAFFVFEEVLFFGDHITAKHFFPRLQFGKQGSVKCIDIPDINQFIGHGTVLAFLCDIKHDLDLQVGVPTDAGWRRSREVSKGQLGTVCIISLRNSRFLQQRQAIEIR